MILPPQFPEQAHALHLDDVDVGDHITVYATSKVTGETTITDYEVSGIERGTAGVAGSDPTAVVTLRPLEAVKTATAGEPVPEIEAVAVELGLLPFIGNHPNSWAFSTQWKNREL